MIELTRRARDAGTPADWLVRAKTVSALPEGSHIVVNDDRLQGLGLHHVHDQTARQAEGAQGAPVTVDEGSGLPAGRGSVVKATCVIAREIDPPEGAEAVEWRLLTHRSATTLDDVI